MRLVNFKYFCFVSIIFLLTCYYISAFRLIHTSSSSPQQTTEKEPKKERHSIDIKEHVRKAYIKHEHKDEKIDIDDEETVPERKTKTVQPTLPSESTKEKIKERVKSPETKSTKDETDLKKEALKMKLLKDDDSSLKIDFDINKEHHSKIKVLMKDDEGKGKFQAISSIKEIKLNKDDDEEDDNDDDDGDDDDKNVDDDDDDEEEDEDEYGDNDKDDDDDNEDDEEEEPEIDLKKEALKMKLKKDGDSSLKIDLEKGKEQQSKVKVLMKDDGGKGKFQAVSSKEEVKLKKDASEQKVEKKPEIDMKKEALKMKIKQDDSSLKIDLEKGKEQQSKVKVLMKDDAGKGKFQAISSKEEVKLKTDSSKEDKEPPKIKAQAPRASNVKPKEENEQPKTKIQAPKTTVVKPKEEKKETDLKKEALKMKLMHGDDSSLKIDLEKSKEHYQSKIKVLMKDDGGKSKFQEVSSKEEVKLRSSEEVIESSKVKKETPKASAPKPKQNPKVEVSKNENPKITEKKNPVEKKEVKKPNNPSPSHHTHVKNNPGNPGPPSNALYFNLPSFAPNFDKVESEECKKQGRILVDQLQEKKLWALKMFDSTAKIPSSILKGNINQFGDYDQCVGIYAKIPIDNKTDADVRISGKYCLAYIDVDAEIKEMKFPVYLSQSRAMIRSKLQDPGHFIPRFTTVRWGLCLPSGCSAEDAETILEDALKLYNNSNSLGLNFDVSVEQDQCNTRKIIKTLWDYPVETLITIGLYGLITLFVFIATIRDLRFSQGTEPSAEENKENKEENDEESTESEKESSTEETEEPGLLEKILMSFSLKRTTKSLLKEDSDPDEIQCIHGIRTICTIVLYIAHKLIPVGHLPFIDKITLTEMANNPFSIILRLSVIYTDSFLLLSGILVSYRMSKDIEEKGQIPWFSRLIARFIRLTPSLVFVLMYYAFVMEYTGDGPLWNTVITPNADLCKEHWWKNALYIQNVYPFQEMCATHTHQLALDMQLFIIAPILVWLLYKRPILGVFTTIILHSVSVILRYYATLNYRLSLIIYHGISISQLYRTANYLYASSIHRATPYLAGVGLGVLLRQVKPNFYLPKIVSIFGWLITGYFAMWALYTPSHLSSRMYQYDITEAAQFSALCSLAWSLALSWIIFSCSADSEGFLNKFLSSRVMVLFSRISYTLYLTQFIVFFYNVGTVRNTAEFKITSSLDLTEMIIILIISTILTLFVDMPVQTIKSVILRSSRTKSQKTTEEEVEESEEIKTTEKEQNNIQKPVSSNKDEDDENGEPVVKKVTFKERSEERDDELVARLISQLSADSQEDLEEQDLRDEMEDDNSAKLDSQLSLDEDIDDMEEDEDEEQEDEVSINLPKQSSVESQLSMDEEHFDEHEEVTKDDNNKLTTQISEEHEMPMDEKHFFERTIEVDESMEIIELEEKNTEDDKFEQQEDEENKVVIKVNQTKDEKEEEEEQDVKTVQSFTLQLAPNGKMTVKEQIEQILNEEEDEN